MKRLKEGLTAILTAGLLWTAQTYAATEGDAIAAQNVANQANFGVPIGTGAGNAKYECDQEHLEAFASAADAIGQMQIYAGIHGTGGAYAAAAALMDGPGGCWDDYEDGQEKEDSADLEWAAGNAKFELGDEKLMEGGMLAAEGDTAGASAAYAASVAAYLAAAVKWGAAGQLYSQAQADYAAADAHADGAYMLVANP